MINVIILMLSGCMFTLLINYLISQKRRKKQSVMEKRHKSNMEWANREAQRRNYQL